MENHEDGLASDDILRNQLAFALRSIQWTYAIFWCISPENPRVLKWANGLYNGDVKTKKSTLQGAEADGDEMGLQRSEQLRELFLSFKSGESAPPPRPSDALSPEDLTDTEWYYLVCMSFTFRIGQGLPGKTYAENQPIWLCNAHLADASTFTRYLLAKSASIQTVVCFPHLGGVIELGVTEQVSEDLNLIQHIKAAYLEISCDKRRASSHHDEVFNSGNLDDALFGAEFVPLLVVAEGEDALMYSSNSNSFGTDRRGMVPCMVEGMNSSSSPSQNFAEKMLILPEGEERNDGFRQTDSSDPRGGEDSFYQSVVSNLLKSSGQLILGPSVRESSFNMWKVEAVRSFQKPQSGSSQRLLKKVLFEAAKRRGGSLINKPRKANCMREITRCQEADEAVKDRVFSGKKRREALDQRFMILSSCLPTNSKLDKLTILDHTIEYMKELETRINDLESLKVSVPKTRRKHHNAAYDTSEKISLARDASTGDVSVAVMDKDITIETRFPWREGALLDILEVLSNLHLDSHSIQSAMTEGILAVTIKSKLKGSKNPTPGTIRRALRKAIWNHQRSPLHRIYT